MCEAGAASAVMGNHEFNAIGWADQNEDGGFLRSHSEKNARQHAKFLHQIEEASADHKDAVRWFRSLPIWLDFPCLRAVHACWHEPSCQALMPFLDEAGRLTEEGIQESYRHGSDAHSAIEVRLRWWDHGATTFRKAALGMDGREDEIPDTKLPIPISRRHAGFLRPLLAEGSAENYGTERSVPRFQRR
jgi:hypothetical protein